MLNAGAEGDRTLDLRIANATLSQLSYRPTAKHPAKSRSSQTASECPQSRGAISRGPGPARDSSIAIRPLQRSLDPAPQDAAMIDGLEARRSCGSGNGHAGHGWASAGVHTSGP